MTDLPKTMRGLWLIGHGDMDMLDIRQDIPVPLNSHASRGLMFAVISLLWVEKSALIELVREY
jgi:hypothetical protein